MATVDVLGPWTVDVVARVFLPRLPVPEEVIAPYDRGKFDGNTAAGRWLRQHQTTVAAGPVNSDMVFFMVPGLFPRFLGAGLIMVLGAGSEEEVLAYSFLDALAFRYGDQLDEFKRDDDEILRELTPLECATALAVYCRVLTRKDAVGYPFGDWRRLAKRLVKGAHGNPKCARLAARLLSRLNNRMARLRFQARGR